MIKDGVQRTEDKEKCAKGARHGVQNKGQRAKLRDQRAFET
jgi:hypothetical protein